MSTFPQLRSIKRDNGLFRLVGHRGARGIMPENTIEGFEFTLDAGLSILECDVVQTKDGVPVVTHNLHLSQVTTRDSNGAWVKEGQYQLPDLNLNDLEAFDVGGTDCHTAYGQEFPDQTFLSNIRIPCLEDLLGLMKRSENKDVYLFLELKSYEGEDAQASSEDDFIKTVVDAVYKYDQQSKVIFHSFDSQFLKKCQEIAPEIPSSFITYVNTDFARDGEDFSVSNLLTVQSPDQTLPKLVAEAGGQVWSPYFKDVTKTVVEEAHGLGITVLPWTVNDQADMQRMIDVGVDGIITDYPGRAQFVLRSNNLSW